MLLVQRLPAADRAGIGRLPGTLEDSLLLYGDLLGLGDLLGCLGHLLGVSTDLDQQPGLLGAVCLTDQLFLKISKKRTQNYPLLIKIYYYILLFPIY